MRPVLVSEASHRGRTILRDETAEELALYHATTGDEAALARRGRDEAIRAEVGLVSGRRAAG